MKPSLEVVSKLLQYDAISGIFIWLQQRGRINAGEIAGSLDTHGYIRIRIFGVQYAAHQLAWLFVNGRWPNCPIDHENGIKTDNRFKNLRQTTCVFNAQNVSAKPRCNNKSGFLGVTFNERYKQWNAHIRYDGKKHNLGRFDTPELASAAYRLAKSKGHTFQPQANR